MYYQYPTAFKSWGQEEHQAIDRVIKSDRFTMGAEVEAFEEEFAAWHSRKYGIMVNSGSSSNLVAVAALCHGYILNTLVSVPAIAWSTTYSPLIQRQFNLKVRDVDSSWNANLSSLDIKNSGLVVLCPVL